MTLRDISNNDDVIYSRDVIARIEELQEEIEAYAAKMDDCQANSDNVEELEKLLALQAEAESYAPHWKHGAVLIRESYFTDYCEELLKGCGDLPQNIPHYIEIDWKKTADNIRVNYTEADFDGVTYLVR